MDLSDVDVFMGNCEWKQFTVGADDLAGCRVKKCL